MKRHVPGLQEATPMPEGFFLVEVRHARCRVRRAKTPMLAVTLTVLEPKDYAGSQIEAEIDCAAKNLWRLNWLLRDFGYDTTLLEESEIDETALVGLRGVIKLSHSTVQGRRYTSLDGFAPAHTWDDFQMEAAG